VIGALLDYVAVVGMNSLAEYNAENAASGLDLTAAELNLMLNSSAIAEDNYAEALERIIDHDSLPRDNPSLSSEQLYLFENQITTDVSIGYVTQQAAGDSDPYIQVFVDADSVGESWDIVFKTDSGSYTTILSGHEITQAEADQGYFLVNDGGGISSSQITAGNGYFNVKPNGEITPIAADYDFTYY
jgi:hypothetical protein